MLGGTQPSWLRNDGRDVVRKVVGKVMEELVESPDAQVGALEIVEIVVKELDGRRRVWTLRLTKESGR